MKQDRTYDLIIWGATGFTGRLVAAYLIKQYGIGGTLKWAIAGRNESKIEQIKQELNTPTLPHIIADSLNKTSLEQMVRQTKVICSTVGPYALYGSLLVEACVEQGTHYCDLTGEVQWIRKMIDKHHSEALKNQVKIVHCCGFDSIPSDFGVYFIQKETQALKSEFCQQVKMRVKGARGGFSGGTYASLSNVLKEAVKDPSIYKVLQNPYSLNPPEVRTGPDQPDLQKAAFDPDLNGWTSPFVMAPINTKIVRRSHALSGFPYGEQFRYDEATWHGNGFMAGIIARTTAFAINLLVNARPNSLFKKWVDRVFPKPGEGPSEEVRENGFFYLLFLGKLSNGQYIKAKVKGDKDPGYGSTSKMLAESAICLAMDGSQLPATYGVLTPTIAMGEALFLRLTQHAGLTFEIAE